MRVYYFNGVGCTPGTTTFPAGKFYLKSGGSPCGVPLDSVSYLPNPGYTDFTYNFQHSGTQQFVITAKSNITSTRWYSDAFSVTTTDYPNLTVSNVNLSSQNVTAGNQVTVTATIENTGSATAGWCSAGIYLNTSSNPNPPGVLLGTSTPFSLYPSNTFSLSQAVTIPSTALASNYYIIVKADLNNVVSEYSENDNADFKYLNVFSPQLPDLQVGNLSLTPTTIGVGGTVTATTSIDNTGNGTAATSIVRYWISTDNIYNNGNDAILASTNVPILSAGGSFTDTKQLNIPTSYLGGTFYIFAYTDAGHNVIEFDENNNNALASFSINAAPPCSIPSYASADTELQSAICYLVQQGILDNNQDYTTNQLPILRQDVAKATYRALFGPSEPNNPAINFPSPFIDINTTTAPYLKYALGLLYLDYADQIPPFKRDGMNFNPTDHISRINTLKVLLEAFNINEYAYTNAMPFQDTALMVEQDKAYLRTAHQLDIVKPATLFNDIGTITRNGCFLMLYRLLTKPNIPALPTTAQLQDLDNYAVPFQRTPYNSDKPRSLAEGNFTYYENPAFTIADRGIFSLSFSHHYDASILEWQPVFTPSEPYVFGKGWTHTYLSYITRIDEGTNSYLVHVAGSGISGYDNTGQPTTPPSIVKGNYNTLTKISSTVYEVKDKAQIKYTYKVVNSNTPKLFMLTDIQDRNNNKLHIAYQSGTNKIDSVIAPSGRFLKFNYGTNSGNPTVTIQYPLSRSISFTLQNGQLRYYKENTNSPTTYEYTVPNRPTLLNTIMLPRGNSILADYDGYGKVKAVTTNNLSNDAQKTTITPPTNFNPTGAYFSQSTSTNDISTNTRYNALGNPLEVANTRDSFIITYGNTTHPTIPTQLKNAKKGAIWQFQNIDANGNVGKIIYPNNTYELFTWNTDNTLATYRSRLNKIYNYTYDPLGNINQIIHPYTGVGTGYPVTTILTNAYGQIYQITNPEWLITKYTYDANGNLSKVKTPALNIETETIYDAGSRPYIVKDTKGNATTITYWDCDIPKTVTDPLGKVTKTFLDANYNVITVVNANNDTAKYTYDENDRDSLNQFLGLERYHYYSSGSINSIKGKLQSIQKPSGSLLTMAYDNVTGLLKSNGYINIDYYADNMPQKITKGGTLINNFTWDADEHWLNSHTDPFGTTTIYSRRVDGSLFSVNYPNGNYVTYIRDTAGRPKEVWWNRTSANAKLIATYYYKQDERLDSMVFDNGMVAQWKYDAGGRMTGLCHLRSATDTIAAWTYVLDSNGNIRDINPLKEPLQPLPPPAGTSTYTYGPYNVLANANGLSYTTTTDGNITNRGGTVISYDVADKLLTYSNGNTAYAATWDGLGHRIAATRNGATTRYVLDISGGLDNVLAETDGNNSVQYYYIHGPTGMLCRIAPNGTVLYYLHDHRGNTVAMADAGKTVTHSYAYGDYGELRNIQEPTGDLNRYRFMGAYGITYEDSILYYVRARHYDPIVGRFYSQDPLDALNLYTYAENNPMNGIDPSGMYAGDAMVGTGSVAGFNANQTQNIIFCYPSLAPQATINSYKPSIAQIVKDNGYADEAAEIVLNTLVPELGAEKAIWSLGKKTNSVKNAYTHWIKHGAEFDEFLNAKQYVEGAQKFFQSTSKDIVSKVRLNGDIILYDLKKNYFGVINRYGTPKTFFKPNNGIKYFLKQ